jgi:chromatin remodeling complex protein RSC6
MKKEDVKCVKKLMNILGKDTDKIEFPELRKNLDFIIITFREKIYDYV